MPVRTRRPARRAATVVECAFVLPAIFFLLFALVAGAMGVFRYHEVATLAREGARYASTHGHQYRRDNNEAMGASEEWARDVYEQGIKPKVVTLELGRIAYEVKWPDVVNQAGKPDNWPGSKVDVTVTYTWVPGWRLAGPIKLTSTSSMPITN